MIRRFHFVVIRFNICFYNFLVLELHIVVASSSSFHKSTSNNSNFHEQFILFNYFCILYRHYKSVILFLFENVFVSNKITLREFSPVNCTAYLKLHIIPYHEGKQFVFITIQSFSRYI